MGDIMHATELKQQSTFCSVAAQSPPPPQITMGGGGGGGGKEKKKKKHTHKNGIHVSDQDFPKY